MLFKINDRRKGEHFIDTSIIYLDREKKMLRLDPGCDYYVREISLDPAIFERALTDAQRLNQAFLDLTPEGVEDIKQRYAAGPAIRFGRIAPKLP